MCLPVYVSLSVVVYVCLVGLPDRQMRCIYKRPPVNHGYKIVVTWLLTTSYKRYPIVARAWPCAEVSCIHGYAVEILIYDH